MSVTAKITIGSDSIGVVYDAPRGDLVEDTSLLATVGCRFLTLGGKTRGSRDRLLNSFLDLGSVGDGTSLIEQISSWAKKEIVEQDVSTKYFAISQGSDFSLRPHGFGVLGGKAIDASCPDAFYGLAFILLRRWAHHGPPAIASLGSIGTGLHLVNGSVKLSNERQTVRDVILPMSERAYVGAGGAERWVAMLDGHNGLDDHTQPSQARPSAASNPRPPGSRHPKPPGRA